MAAGPSPDCTVVVITRDRCVSLGRTLARLRALPEAPPVIVVDNGSSDATRAVVEAAGVHGLFLGHNAGAAGRNLGVAAATTRAVAFSDDDSWWAPGALAAAVERLDRHPRCALLAARVLVGPEGALDPACREMRASRFARAPDLPGPSVLGFLACGAILRRDAFLAAGGFHPRYGVGGEERLLAIDLARRGWGLAYCDDVVAHHHPETTGGVRPGRRARMVRNDLWTAWLRAGPRDAAARTASTVAAGWRDAEALRGLAMALRGVPWVLRERRAAPRPLRAALRRLG